MKPDNFEQKLQRQPLRQVPAEWRGEILVAADVNRRNRPVREFTFAATPFGRFLSTLNAQLSTLLWPHPQGLGGSGGGLDFDCGGEFFHARPIAGPGGEIFATFA